MTTPENKTYKFLNYTLTFSYKDGNTYFYGGGTHDVSIVLEHNVADGVDHPCAATLVINLPVGGMIKLQSQKDKYASPWDNATPEAALQVLVENFARVRYLPWL